MLLNGKLEYPLAPDVQDDRYSKNSNTGLKLSAPGDHGVCKSHNRCPFLMPADTLAVVDPK
jgi:hypothetical protein